mgnify:CR=1 FL=1
MNRATWITMGAVVSTMSMSVMAAPVAQRASSDFVSTVPQIEGDTDPLNLGTWVDVSSGTTWPGVTLNGDGTFTITTPALGVAQYPAIGWNTEHGNFLSTDAGWTVEMRFRVDAANYANRGVFELYLRDNDGENPLTTRVHILANGIVCDSVSPGVNTEYATDFTDGFHTIRITGRSAEGYEFGLTSVWIDDVLVIDDQESSAYSDYEIVRIGRWGSQTGGGTITIDYIRLDTTGAYAPAVPEPASLALLGLGSLCALRRRRR